MEKAHIRTPAQREKMQASLRAMEKKPLPHMLCVTNMLLHGIEDPSFVRHDNTLARPYISYTQSDRVDLVLTNPPFGGREEDGIESNFPAHFRTGETAAMLLAFIIRLLKPGGRAAVVLPDGSLFGEGVKTRLKEHLMEECNLHTIVRLPNSVFKPYASIGTNLLFFEKGTPTKDIWFWEHRVPGGQKAYSMTKPIRLEHFQDCINWWGGNGRKGREETPQAWKVSAEEVMAGEISRDGPPIEIDQGRFPMIPPAGWILARLAAISRRIHYGYTASADVALKDVRMLRITDIQENAVDWPSVPGCLIEPDSVEQYRLQKGDILIARTGGTIGKTFLVGDVPLTAVF